MQQPLGGTAPKHGGAPPSIPPGPRTPRGASDGGAKISDAQRVLVVDDDADVRDSLRRALGYAGYEVATAVNGAEALKSVARSPVDLIILDVLMPMLDGLGACRALRDRGDGTPVLVLTARDTVDDRVAGLDAGADDYLVKPFALRELVARMNALLRRAQPPRDVLGYADLTLDLTARTVRRGDGRAQLHQDRVRPA